MRETNKARRRLDFPFQRSIRCIFLIYQQKAIGVLKNLNLLPATPGLEVLNPTPEVQLPTLEVFCPILGVFRLKKGIFGLFASFWP